MLALFQSAVYLGGNLIFFSLLVLPAVFLLSVSVVYFIVETIHNFRSRGDAF